MSDISYIQVEQGIKILELEAALAAEKATTESLRHQLQELERDKERLRLESLALQRTAQLAEVALEKAEREIPNLKAKLAESDKERKLLKGLNPEKLKRNLVEQKRKTEEAKSAVDEWRKRTKESRDEHKSEVKDLHKVMLQMLEERDFFAEVNGYRLTLSRFRFPTDPENQKTKTRIRVTNVETSESCVVLYVNTEGSLQLLSGMTLPDDVSERVRAEWASIRETGKVTAESSDAFDFEVGSLG